MRYIESNSGTTLIYSLYLLARGTYGFLKSLSVMWGDTALSLNRTPYTLLIRGNIAGITGSPEQAVDFFSESLDISEVYHEARFQRARYLWMIGAIEEAMEDYCLLMQLNYLMLAFESMLEW